MVLRPREPFKVGRLGIDLSLDWPKGIGVGPGQASNETSGFEKWKGWVILFYNRETEIGT